LNALLPPLARRTAEALAECAAEVRRIVEAAAVRNVGHRPAGKARLEQVAAAGFLGTA
jgi:hypothetical protein